MSLLAEPRRKQKISVDPQNIQWRDDDNKVSKKMMEKMGWADGKGLGRNNHGNVDAVKLKANHSGKGLGADKIASYDSTWIGHHDDFADLLASLNKNKPKTDETEEEKKERVDKISIELSSKSVRRRIHYQKFTRMKDTANYSEQDKSAVLGVGLKRTKEESSDEDSSAVKSEPENVSVDQGNTTVSTLSVGDYFAAKMAALKAKSQACAVVVKKEEITIKTEIEDGEEFISENLTCDIEVKTEEIEETDKDRRKREKKLKKQLQAKNEQIVEEQPEEEDEETRRKRRKEEKRQMKLLKKEQEEEAAIVKQEPEEPVEEEMTEKQRRKMEKRLRKMQEAEEATAVEEEVPKKKKKL